MHRVAGVGQALGQAAQPRDVGGDAAAGGEHRRGAGGGPVLVADVAELFDPAWLETGPRTGVYGPAGPPVGIGIGIGIGGGGYGGREGRRGY